MEMLTDELLGMVQAGDLVITMGAGDVHTVASQLVEKLREKEPHVH
jgi:UDP-N-acetylmuramate-alanine ligase